MNILDIINKKRLKQELTKEEIHYFVDEYTKGTIPDYQMSSLLMAICCNGMSFQETIFLTNSMLESGEVLDLSSIDGKKVDKHSTGGVGDKTTIILGPLVASCGVKVAKMSGRGLGHTGGTIDKLESIPGFQVSKTIQEVIEQVNQIGVCVVSQTGNLVPADKKIYALRDVTATVESLPLIASSIMSKKIASSTDFIVIDLKVGDGALIKTIEDARKLAHLMVQIGKNYHRKTVCILTNMEKPLGHAIGNALEIEESIRFLKREEHLEDLEEIIVTLASWMVHLGKDISLEEAKKEVQTNLENGKAYRKFQEFISYQGGNLEQLKVSNRIFSIKSPKTGFVSKINTLKLGELVRSIGAGRYSKEDKIDYTVGALLNKNVGDYVLEGEELVKIYLNQKDMSLREITECFTIEESLKKQIPLILEVIDK